MISPRANEGYPAQSGSSQVLTGPQRGTDGNTGGCPPFVRPFKAQSQWITMEPSRQARLESIKSELQQLSESPLYAYRVENRYLPVPGEGSPDAAIMFIGEAPGEWEAKSGRPFVGASGRLLDTLLASIDLRRADVYITNVVKDRPPDNRPPAAAEIRLYTPFLQRQIEIIQPRVIVPLGRHALEFVRKHFTGFPAEGSVSTLHGTAYPVDAPYGRAFIMPLYHPAVLFYREDLQEAMEADFRLLAELVNGYNQLMNQSGASAPQTVS